MGSRIVGCTGGREGVRTEQYVLTRPPAVCRPSAWPPPAPAAKLFLFILCVPCAFFSARFCRPTSSMTSCGSIWTRACPTAAQCADKSSRWTTLKCTLTDYVFIYFVSFFAGGQSSCPVSSLYILVELLGISLCVPICKTQTLHANFKRPLINAGDIISFINKVSVGEFISVSVYRNIPEGKYNKKHQQKKHRKNPSTTHPRVTTYLGLCVVCTCVYYITEPYPRLGIIISHIHFHVCWTVCRKTVRTTLPRDLQVWHLDRAGVACFEAPWYIYASVHLLCGIYPG